MMGERARAASSRPTRSASVSSSRLNFRVSKLAPCWATMSVMQCTRQRVRVDFTLGWATAPGVPVLVKT